jgi:hypothetical protein
LRFDTGKLAPRESFLCKGKWMFNVKGAVLTKTGPTTSIWSDNGTTALQ